MRAKETPQQLFRRLGKELHRSHRAAQRQAERFIKAVQKIQKQFIQNCR
jgi:hypothetical protein